MHSLGLHSANKNFTFSPTSSQLFIEFPARQLSIFFFLHFDNILWPCYCTFHHSDQCSYHTYAQDHRSCQRYKQTFLVLWVDSWCNNSLAEIFPFLRQDFGGFWAILSIWLLPGAKKHPGIFVLDAGIESKFLRKKKGIDVSKFHHKCLIRNQHQSMVIDSISWKK